jgi:hypothetical protein
MAKGGKTREIGEGGKHHAIPKVERLSQPTTGVSKYDTPL